MGKMCIKCCGVCREPQEEAKCYFVLQVNRRGRSQCAGSEGLLSPVPIHIPLAHDRGEGRLIAELCLYGLVGLILQKDSIIDKKIPSMS